MNNEQQTPQKITLFVNAEIDLSFIDDNVEVLSKITGSTDVMGIKNKHLSDVAKEVEDVLKKYSHITTQMQAVDPNQMAAEQEAQKDQEAPIERVNTEIVE